MASTSIPSPDEALAGMAKIGAPREPMMNSGTAFTTAPTSAGKLVPKSGNAKAGDPTAMGTKKNRENVLPSSAERNGAAYSIRGARYTKMTDPAAGETQANGMIVKHAVKRDRKNFDQGNASAY